MRRERRGFEHHFGQRTAVNRDGARKHHARTVTRGTANLEQRARTVEVDPHPEIEIRFCLSADDRREMEDAGGSSRDDLPEQRAVRDVARCLRDARVVEAVRRDDIGQRDLVNPFVPAVGADETAALEQPGCEGLAEESGAAGDRTCIGEKSYRTAVRSRARGSRGRGSR